MLRKLFGLILLVLMATSASVNAQNPEEVRFDVTPVADGIYMISGRGGNVGMSIGKDGVFLVDDNYAPVTPAILEAIATVTDKPVRFILNTHYHGDHTGGNEYFGKTGTVIVAHENVRERMSSDQLRDWLGQEVPVPATTPGAWPIVTFDSTVTFHVNGHDIYAFHVKNAHTDGDSMIYFRERNVIHVGDVVFYGLYPYIDYMNGGSIKGTIAGVEQVLEMIDDETKVIPGHGPLTDKAGLEEYRHVLTTIVGRIEGMIAEGKTVEEITAARPSQQFDAKWGQSFTRPDGWVPMIYRDLIRSQ